MALVAFMLLGSSFVLQLINSLTVPLIHGLSFLDFDLVSQGSHGEFFFGIWGWCSQQTGHALACRRTGPGDYDAFLDNLQKTLSLRSVPFEDPFLGHLPQALVLQPISAGFMALAAGAALLAVCTNSFLWVLAGLWAALLTIATLVIELVLFVNARDNFRDIFEQLDAFDTYTVGLGKANWLQVAATAAAIVGAVIALVAFITNSTQAGDGPHTPVAATPAAQWQTPYAQHEPIPMPPPVSQVDAGYAAPETAYEPTQPVVQSTSMGRAYDTNQPYEGAVVPMANRHRQLYNEREAGSRPGDRVKSDEKQARRHSKRHSRRHSRHATAGESRTDLLPRHSFEYDYDYDAFPARRMSFDYGGPSHVRHRSTTMYHGRDPTRGYADRGSRLYPDDVYDQDGPQPTAHDQARWRRLSNHLSY
ncbi:hypothetical protein MNAN1_001368 [Malassezia nana]|uniref:Uncharacterized protein n=1 Tax=Malassezia nana TaxID=180528 RepID=A0AAF0EL75_9BASI|nr:hypothetical protein MNAN1_001368 [Malassezia nana]